MELGNFVYKRRGALCRATVLGLAGAVVLSHCVLAREMNSEAWPPLEDGLETLRSYSLRVVLDRLAPGYAQPSRQAEALRESAGREFAELTRALGRYQRFEPAGEVVLSESNARLYVVLLFEHGAAYGRFNMVRLKNRWVLTELALDVEAEEVFPESLLE